MGAAVNNVPAGEHVEWRLRYRTERSGGHDLATTDAERAAFWYREATDNEFCLDVKLTRRTLSVSPWQQVDAVTSASAAPITGSGGAS